jgi:hypothetical protein
MLCPWVHNCQAFEIGYHPTIGGLGECSRCGREWLPRPERLGGVVVHPDGATCRPRWTAYDARNPNKFGNQGTGEIVEANQALACDGALDRTEPCATRWAVEDQSAMTEESGRDDHGEERGDGGPAASAAVRRPSPSRQHRSFRIFGQ